MTPPRPGRRKYLGPVAALAVAIGLSAGCSDSGSGPRPSAAPAPVTTREPDRDDPGSTAVPAVTNVNGSETSVILEPGVTSNNVGGPRIACRVELTGARSAAFNTYDDATAFSSDHYLSERELEQARSTPRSTLAGVAAPTLPPDAAPVAGWFILNCQGGDITLSVVSDPRSTTDDIPFGSATYRVGSGTGGTEELIVIASFFRDPSQLWSAESGATLTVERFDEEGAAGSFDIPMRRTNVDGTPTDDRIRFTGGFVVTCRSGSRCAQI
jgi:hypothetical protein